MNSILTIVRNYRQCFANAVSYFSRHYAAVLFCDNPAVGIVVLAITYSVPNIGSAGLLAALSAYLFARRLGFTTQFLATLQNGCKTATQQQEPYIYNSLLVGLSLGSIYQLNGQLIALIIVSAISTVFVTQFLANTLWQFGRLPVLSLPFVLVTWMVWLIARSTTGLMPFVAALPDHTYIIPWVANIFKSLGLFFFVPHPLAGMLLFVAIAWTSRYLALLALSGYLAGFLTLLLIVGDAQGAPYIGFNFMLVAMAVGGIFSVPSKMGFAVAVFGAALSALLAVAVARVSLPYGLPVLTMPFVLASLIILAGLSRRAKVTAPYLLLDKPALPEASYERVRLASARTGEIGSVPLLPPFLGQWHVYQSFNGAHTHQPPWQHALDFFILEGKTSFRQEGRKLEDYYCFGATVVAPAPGQIVACRDDLLDNPPGEVDTVRNWGNYLQIQIASGAIVVLAHLRQNSLLVKEGDWVTAGQWLANCGNSGRSPQPHLHMHVQNELVLGNPTIPFHLCNVITRAQTKEPATFQLNARPAELVSITPAARDDKLAQPLHLPVGRCLYFRFRSADSDWQQRSLKVELTLLGQFRLLSDTGASVAFEETQELLAFYDRQGNRDIFLDMWCLGMGLTPFSNSATQWWDQPSASLMPLPRWQSTLLKIRPLGTALHSSYQRHWDFRTDSWQQHGVHILPLLPRLSVKATTSVTLSPATGCSALTMQAAGQHWEAELQATGLSADNGVPEWMDFSEADVATETQSVNA